METVKWRSDSIEHVLKGNISHGKEILDYEFCAVQLRKILELIVFSSLISHKDSYSSVYKNFRKHWNVKTLMENLEEVNPNFYPIPMFYDNEKSKPNYHHFGELDEGYLLKEEVIELYDYCGGIIHTRNPYRTDGNKIDIRNSVAVWLQRIKNLLTLHRIQLVNSNEVWVVNMVSPETGNVQAHIAVANEA